MAAYHSNLGTILQAQGRLEEAAAAYRRALAIDPEVAETLGNLKSVLLALGRRGEAVTCFEAALARRPLVAEFHFHLGHGLQLEGRLEEATLSYEKALVLRPSYAAAHANLGGALLGMARAGANSTVRASVGSPEWARLTTAVGHYRAALELEGNLAEAHNGLGGALYALGDFVAAEEAYARALVLRPEYVEAHSNYGTLLEARGELEAAVARHERALAQHPEYAEAHNSLGNALRSLGRTAEAAAHFERALELKPELTEAYYNLAVTQLGAGEFAAGWRNYEWRWDVRWSPLGERVFARPQWRGEELKGARILIHAEQGLGDTLQFLRYIPRVAKAGGTVIFLVQARLRRLAQQVPGVAEMLVSGDVLPEFAWHCPLLSLPLAFGTTLETIPAEMPYLSVPEAARLRMEQALRWPEAGLRVGLCWAGNPTFVGDRARHRSLPFGELRPLLERAGAHFFSLQVGAARTELEGAGWAAARVVDLAPHGVDMADTAAQVAGLDLVITVDTSVAHLAGGLGVKTWVLLPFAADWRWLRERTDSPWYPGMRLFRQPRPGDWAAVVGEVGAALEEMARLR